MNLKLTTTALLLSSLALTGPAFADCVGSTVKDVKRSYESAQTSEKRGNKEDALRLYHAAEDYVCENVNPYAADAAKRAAPLGLELGGAAEKAGNFSKAAELYENGGHFVLADRAYMATVRLGQDSPDVFQNARSYFDTRSLESFQSNNADAIKVTGAYHPDTKYIAEVKAMPPKGLERAAQREVVAFNEQYLRDVVQTTQARADDMTDSAALQRTMTSQQALAQKWQQKDLMKQSRQELELMRQWGSIANDAAFEKSADAQVTQRIEQHVQLLTQKYSGAPQLLDDAMDFVRILHLDPVKEEPRIAGLKSQASKLGDDADAKQRYTLAVDYYQVAGNDAKSDAVRAKRDQLAMQKMQPGIDAAKRQAEEMQKQFGDPAKVQAMRDQAEAARKSLQQRQQQGATKQANRKSAEELEKELGL